MTRVRFMFDSLQSAAKALETVLMDARVTEYEYKFAGISAEQILKSGLIVEGEVVEVATKLNNVEGSAIFEE